MGQPDLDRVARNVGRMISLNAPEEDIDAYIASEGTSVDAVRAHNKNGQGAGRFAQPAIAASEPAKMGALEAGARGVAQGLSFGFDDELVGAGKGVAAAVTGGDFAPAYEQGRDAWRAANKQAADAQPVAYYGGQVAGGVAVPFGAARAGAAALRAAPGALAPVAATGRALGFGQLSANAASGIGARTVAGAREGAAYGALAGFGEGEGGAGDRASSAARGALFGGGVGAAAPGLVDAGSAVMRGVTTPIRAVMQPQRVGREKVAEALLRDVSGEAVAQPGYGAAFARLAGRLQSGVDADKTMMLADAGGENMRNLLRAASNQQSTGAERLRKTLDRRQANQWHRINVDVDRHLGGLAYDAENVQRAAQQAQRAQQSYGRVYRMPLQGQAAQDIEAFISDRPFMQRLFDLTQSNVQGMRGTNVEIPPWELLHRTRMQIDHQLRQLRRGQPDPVANWTAHDLQDLRTQFSALLERHNPHFARANLEFADDAAVLNAAEEAFDSFKTAPVEELARMMQRADAAGPAVAQAFRRGAGRSLVGDVMRGNKMRDRTENVFSSPDIEQRLEVIFPNRRQLREFQRALVLEAKMADTRKAVQGNSTTARQLAQADEAGQPMRMAVGAAQAATGRFEPALNLLGRTAQRFSGITPSTANAIIEAAMERDPQRVRAALATAMRRAGTADAARAQVAQEIMAGATSARE